MQSEIGILKSTYHEASTFQTQIFISEVYKNMHLHINPGSFLLEIRVFYLRKTFCI